MRIMLVVNEFPPEKIAGTAMATQALAEHLAVRGHQVLVVVTTSCPKHVRNQIIAKDYTLIWLKPRPFRGLGWLWRFWQTWSAGKRFSPQIIQGQAVSCGLIAAVVGRLLHVPSLCYAQGYDVYQATWLQQKTEIRWGCAWPNQLLAVTDDLAASIQRVVDVPNVIILPHAFEFPEEKKTRQEIRQQYGLQASATLVLSVGRLETFKGHDVLLLAWQHILLKKPSAKLWIAGIGGQLESLQKLVVRLGIQDSVTFLGYLSKDGVHQVMQASDLFVLPSRSEPFGIVLLEAMAHGLPVVASDVGGIPEVLPKQGDALLVPADDAEALTNAMLKSIDRELLEGSVVNREHAMAFEWRNQVKRFESIYLNMIE